jgi:hypothetical protein
MPQPPPAPNMTTSTTTPTTTSSRITTLPNASSTWGKNNVNWPRIPTKITCFTEINSSQCFLLL